VRTILNNTASPFHSSRRFKKEIRRKSLALIFICSITSFLKRASRPVVTDLVDDEGKATAFQSVDEAVLIAHVNPRDEHVAAAFKTLASRFRDRATFGLVPAATSTVACYNNRDEQKFTVSDFSAVNALDRLFESCTAPLIGEFTRASEMRYLQVSFDTRDSFFSFSPFPFYLFPYLVFGICKKFVRSVQKVEHATTNY